VISGILPPVLLALLMQLLPSVLRRASSCFNNSLLIKVELAASEGIPSKTSVELDLMTRYFVFLVVVSIVLDPFISLPTEHPTAHLLRCHTGLWPDQLDQAACREPVFGRHHSCPADADGIDFLRYADSHPIYRCCWDSAASRDPFAVLCQDHPIRRVSVSPDYSLGKSLILSSQPIGIQVPV